jgi:transcriptional regulator NrdR family protein
MAAKKKGIETLDIEQATKEINAKVKPQQNENEELKRMTVVLPSDLHEELKIAAIRYKTTMRELIFEAVKENLKKRKETK